MAEEEKNGADVAVEFAGQKVNLKNIKSLNTLATVATLIIVVLLAYVGWEHKMDAKASATEQQSAYKDMAQAIREGNCLNSYPEHVRETKIDHCKRMVR